MMRKRNCTFKKYRQNQSLNIGKCTIIKNMNSINVIAEKIKQGRKMIVK